MTTSRKIIGLILFWAVSSLPLCAQTTSGSIAGSVQDSQGAAIPGAKVTATSVEKTTSVTATTDNTGRFVFAQLLPGHYTITVEGSGFKKFERQDVILNANDSLVVGVLTLQVGTVVQTMEVHAEGILLETESAERSGAIVGQQLQNIEVNGRSYLYLLRLVPGIYATGDFSTAGHQMGGVFVNGSRSNQANLTLDGAGNIDTGNNGDQLVTVSLDSVQEFKVLTADYGAQYGRSSGAQISVVSKSGTKDFHGSGYWYRRHDSMNANNWKNNRDGLPKQLFRFNDYGYTIGGPAYIPGKFNRNKDKLFFFWSQEYQRQLRPQGVRNVKMPTALERQGDFSQSVDGNRNLFNLIRDASTGLPCSSSDKRGCFQDGGVLGKIPQNRLWEPGVNLLKIYPLPNADSPANKGFNFQSQISDNYPRREDFIRIDYNLSSKWRLFGHYINNKDAITSAYGSFVLGTNFPLVPIRDARPGHGLVLSATTMLSPTSTNEATFDFHHNQINIDPVNDGLTRSKTGLTGINVLFPPNQDFIPHVGFGGKIGSNPNIGTGNAPFFNYNTTIEWIDNFSKVWKQHFIKAGVYIQRSRKDQTSFAQANGDINFGDSASNPLDTGYGYANALLGIFSSFNQASKYATGLYRYTNVEFYIADTWKVRPRLTLDYGMRFYWIQPQFDASLQTSNFLRDKYDPSKAVRLYFPQCGDPQCKTKVAVDAATAQTQPPAFIGTIVPNSGNVTNGVFKAGDGISKYLIENRGIHYGPRFGVAYDLTGEQKLVLRAGVGAFYDRYQGNIIFDELTNPPTTFTPQLVNGFDQSINPSNALFAPSTLLALSFDGKVPTVYNYNLGLQSKLPWAVVLDVAYVGSVSNHLVQRQNFNAIPYGTTFQPQNQDPTKVAQNPGALLGSNAYDANFLRRFQGYGDIQFSQFGVNSNYNSLQVGLNRRFAKGVFLGLAYTWSKALGTASGDRDFIRIDNNTRLANYGPLSFDVRHNFAVNYVYGLPGVPASLGGFNNRVTRAILNNWQISGLTSFLTGTPHGVGFGFKTPGIGNAQITGSYTEPARINLIGDPKQGTTDDAFHRINPLAFAPPKVGSIGLGAPVNYLTNPGINNWDISLQKNIPLKERLHLEFRIDAFNAFNHPQFSSVNSGLQFNSLTDPTLTNLPFNPDGTLRDKNGFGTIGGVRSPRILELVARIVF